MSGRMDQDAKKEKWIQNHVSKCCPLIQKYMISKKSPVLTSTTRKAYLGYLIQYEDYMKRNGIELVKVLPMDIDTYRDSIHEGNGISIVNAKLSAVHSFYEFLLDNDLVKKNPCDKKKYKMIKEEKYPVYLTAKEERQLKCNITNNQLRKTDKWRNRDLCIITIGLSTGLRISEITNIDVDDIDFENKVINNVYVKGGYTRDIYIGDNTIAAINKWLIDRALYVKDPEQKALFVSQKGGRISNSVVEKMIRRETSSFDKHITPHKMRHTCATKLYKETGDINAVAEQLGHKNLRNTRIYAHTTEDMKRKAAAILD